MSHDPHLPLRDDVRMLGELLGRVLQQHGEPDLFARVERVRALAKSATDDNDDFDKLADSAGDAASSIRRLEQVTGTKTLPTDIWIDSQGRARRQAIDYSIQQPAPMRMQFTIDYERFGVPVDVSKPDAGDTVDLADVIGN